MKRLAVIFAISLILLGAFNIEGILAPRNETRDHVSTPCTSAPDNSSSDSISIKPSARNDREKNGWSDSFEDGEGVVWSDNLSIGDGSASLLPRTQLPDDHTLGLWHLDGWDANTAVDSGVYDNRGIIHGADRTEGIMGGGLEFDGVNDFVDCGDDASLEVGDSFTVEVWMKPEMDRWSGWDYSNSITIGHKKVHGTLVDFPLLVSLTKAELLDTNNGGHVQPDGEDLLFITANGSKLSHELEEYNGSIGMLVAWVKLPLLSSTADTVFYLRYGNPICSNQQDPENVWDGYHKMVQHLNEKEGSHEDSTVNGNNGTCFHGVVQDSAGKIGGCDEFDGSDDYIEIQHDASLDIWGDELSLEAWINPQNIDSHMYVISRGNDFYAMLMSWQTISYYFMKAGWKWDNVDSPYGSIYSNDRWYHVAITMDGATVKIFIDGEMVKTKNKGDDLQMGESAVRIGAKINNQFFFKGSIDEVRISDTARNASWIETAYDNQNEPGNFIKFGDRMGAGIRKGGSYGINANTTFAFATIDNRTISTPISSGWNHIAETYDNKDLKLYVNGELKGTKALPGLPPNNDEKLFISPSFHGKIDEVHIINRAVTPMEILDHSQAFRAHGSLKSTSIEIPPNMVWDTFSFNRSVPDKTYLNISLHDTVSGERLFEDSAASDMGSIDISEINPLNVSSFYLAANFHPYSRSSPTLFEWSVNYSSPEAPKQTGDIPRIDIMEDTPRPNVLDLANYFNDSYSDFSPSVYAVENNSEPANLELSFNETFLAVDSLADNWTGAVELRVSCTNVFGISTLSSPFDVVVSNVNDPPLVKLLSPLDGSNQNETNVTLYWIGFDIDNAESDISFDLYFGNTDPLPLHTQGISGESLSISKLDRGVTYRWFLLPSDGTSNGGFVSGTWSFTTNPIKVPEVILLAPLNRTVVYKTEVRAVWEIVNLTGTPILYDVYLGAAPDDLMEIASTSENEFLFTGLSNDSTYYWTVIPVVDSNQGRCVNGIWEFHVNLSGDPSQLEIFLNEDNINITINATVSFNITINNKGILPQ
ncbi:MAG: DUF2341 domain-containing protein [Candidatus Thermoplasmatota archaeon]|jgi:hypothetical protein|nr:DUF2341 domain-containing protein [Candidatus Thermoplasmatota archaeon]